MLEMAIQAGPLHVTQVKHRHFTMASLPGVEYKERPLLLFSKHVNAISLHENDFKRIDVLKRRINTETVHPVRQSLRRISQSRTKAVDDQFEDVIKQKLIISSMSRFDSNMVLVEKKDETYRFCVE